MEAIALDKKKRGSSNTIYLESHSYKIWSLEPDRAQYAFFAWYFKGPEFDPQYTT